MSAERVRHALVFGGSGTVGREVVRQLTSAGIATVFTYHRAGALAQELVGETGARALPVDLIDSRTVGDLVRGLAPAPDVFIHCAAIGGGPLGATDDAGWAAIQAVNCGAAFIACRELMPTWRERGGADVVHVGALASAQSLPIPPAFAASQGALGALTMSLAKELGPLGVRVNMVALGVLQAGLSSGMSADILAHYENFSCLRRRGTAAEVARAICWLALENGYINGKIIPVNGGI